MTIKELANWGNLSILFEYLLIKLGGIIMVFINEEIYKNYFGIYKITNTINNCVYIGQTRQKFIKRYWHHKWKLKNNTHDNKYLQNSWNKYGEGKFVFEVLKVVDDVNVLNIEEIKFIDYYRKIGNCYNVQDGGQPIQLNKYISSESRKRIGELNRKRMIGSKLSEETKKRMSESRKGKFYTTKNTVLSDSIVFEIKQRLINGQKTSDIAKELDVKYGHINNLISNNTWSHVKVNGWDEFLLNRKTYKRLTKKDHLKIYELYINDKYSIEELVNKYNRTIDMIKKIIKDNSNKIYDNPVPSSEVI